MTLDGGCSLIPLLLPSQHGLPFAVALHVCGAGAGSACCSPHAPDVANGLGGPQNGSPSVPPSHHGRVLELHYVLSGRGWLVKQGGGPSPLENAAAPLEAQLLVPGDSVLMERGAARVVSALRPQREARGCSTQPQAGAATQAAPSQGTHGAVASGLGAAPRSQALPWADGRDESLVTLRLLLPAALLREPGPDEAAARPAAARAAADSWKGVVTGTVTPDMAASVLAAPLTSSVLGGDSPPASGSGQPWPPPAGAAPAQGAPHPMAMHGSRLLNAVQSALASAASRAEGLLQSSRGASPQQQEGTMTSGQGAPGQASPRSQAASAPPPAEPLVHVAKLRQVGAHVLPGQSNRLALLFGPNEPHGSGLSLSFGLEIFEAGHRTPPHVHNTAHELFFVLAGEGEAFAGDRRCVVRAGDVAVFPPGVVHGIDVPPLQQEEEGRSGAGAAADTARGRLYCLQLMTPNEAFVEWVRSGEWSGSLQREDLCRLVHAAYC